MNNRKLSTLAMTLMMTALLSLSGGIAFAADSAPLTPEYAAKVESVRKQHNQRISHVQRKAAAEKLKSERLKVYKAKQLVNKPASTNNKK